MLAGLMSRWIRPASWAAPALGDLPADAQHFRQRQLGFALEAVIERFAFQELHGQEGDAAVLADLIDGDDVVVLEAAAARPRGGSVLDDLLRPVRAAWP